MAVALMMVIGRAMVEDEQAKGLDGWAAGGLTNHGAPAATITRSKVSRVIGHVDEDTMLAVSRALAVFLGLADPDQDGSNNGLRPPRPAEVARHSPSATDRPRTGVGSDLADRHFVHAGMRIIRSYLRRGLRGSNHSAQDTK